MSKPGYAAPGTRSRPLLLVGIQGVSCGGQCSTQGLRLSVDVLVQCGALPYHHSVTMLTPFAPKKEMEKNWLSFVLSLVLSIQCLMIVWHVNHD